MQIFELWSYLKVADQYEPELRESIDFLIPSIICDTDSTSKTMARPIRRNHLNQ